MLPQSFKPAAVRARRASLDGARVLVAEDNLVNLEVARFHLEDLGCIAEAAENGAVALALAEREPFDFILMDCQMPVMDGFAALAAIRTLGATHFNAKTPILAVTAADDVQSKLDCARAGFDGFLAKPFSAAQLRAVLLYEPAAPVTICAVAAPSELGPIDREHFAAFVADFGIETAPSLLASYVRLLAESVVRFDHCAENSDISGLQALGHKLAGASGMVGARQLQMRAKEIDACGKRKQLQFTPVACALRDDIVAAHALLAPLVNEERLNVFLAAART